MMSLAATNFVLLFYPTWCLGSTLPTLFLLSTLTFANITTVHEPVQMQVHMLDVCRACLSLQPLLQVSLLTGKVKRTG